MVSLQINKRQCAFVKEKNPPALEYRRSPQPLPLGSSDFWGHVPWRGPLDTLGFPWGREDVTEIEHTVSRKYYTAIESTNPEATLAKLMTI